MMSPLNYWPPTARGFHRVNVSRRGPGTWHLFDAAHASAFSESGVVRLFATRSAPRGRVLETRGTNI